MNPALRLVRVGQRQTYHSVKAAVDTAVPRPRIVPLFAAGAAVATATVTFCAGTEAKKSDTVIQQLENRLDRVMSKLRETGALFDNTTVLRSRAVQALFTVVRDESASNEAYVEYADRLCTILAEEGLARVNGTRPVYVKTPCGTYSGLQVPRYDGMCVVSVVRSGDILTEAVRKVAKGIAVGKVLCQRNESDPEKRPQLFYSKLPKDISSRQVILADPMLATGGSACMAIKVLLDAGVREENILFVNVVSCPEGIQRLARDYPKVRIVTAAIDEKLNSDKFIVPGLGDFGDRYYRTT